MTYAVAPKRRKKRRECQCVDYGLPHGHPAAPCCQIADASIAFAQANQTGFNHRLLDDKDWVANKRQNEDKACAWFDETIRQIRGPFLAQRDEKANYQDVSRVCPGCGKQNTAWCVFIQGQEVREFNFCNCFVERDPVLLARWQEMENQRMEREDKDRDRINREMAAAREHARLMQDALNCRKYQLEVHGKCEDANQSFSECSVCPLKRTGKKAKQYAHA